MPRTRWCEQDVNIVEVSWHHATPTTQGPAQGQWTLIPAVGTRSRSRPLANQSPKELALQLTQPLSHSDPYLYIFDSICIYLMLFPYICLHQYPYVTKLYTLSSDKMLQSFRNSSWKLKLLLGSHHELLPLCQPRSPRAVLWGLLLEVQMRNDVLVAPVAVHWSEHDPL